MTETKMKNTTPEMYEETVAESGSVSDMSQAEILMSEGDLLQGLLDLVGAKDDAESYRKIQIRRNGVLKLEFRVRPISEDESQKCWRNATKYAKQKNYGQPKVAIETDRAKYRSFIIYSATVDEDRAKIWDNKKAQEAAGVFSGVDLIDKVLLQGEKDAIMTTIDEVSGYTEEMQDVAKN